MPNKNSKNGHKPIRTCVICKKKDEKSRLLRFIVIKGEIIFDMKQRVLKRGYYVCNDNRCIIRLKKWKQKKKLKI